MHESKVLEKKIELLRPRAAATKLWAGVTRSWPGGPDMGQLQQDVRFFATRRI
jgi:hypothetical protein